MELDAMRFGNSPFGGKAAFDPHPATAFAVQSDLMGHGMMMPTSSTPEGVFAGVKMPRAATLLSTEQFLGAVADQRKLMFQERVRAAAEPSFKADEAVLNAARTPSPGLSGAPSGPRGGGYRGRGMGGRTFVQRGGNAGRGRPQWNGQRPRVHSQELARSAATLQTSGSTAFARAPMDEAVHPHRMGSGIGMVTGGGPVTRGVEGRSGSGASCYGSCP